MKIFCTIFIVRKNFESECSLKVKFLIIFRIHTLQDRLRYTPHFPTFLLSVDNNRDFNLSYIAWVKENKTNFCGVDWRGLASGSYFTAALEHVQTVGKQLAQFIISLVKLSSKTMDSVRIAGHSLGAHVSGFAGQTIYEKSKTKISTIFALDAAAPTFTFKVLLVDKSNFTLSKENAKFVQCMQTTSSLGTDENLGHAGFIANGGSVQRTCFEEVRERKTECLLPFSSKKNVFNLFDIPFFGFSNSMQSFLCKRHFSCIVHTFVHWLLINIK